MKCLRAELTAMKAQLAAQSKAQSSADAQLVRDVIFRNHVASDHFFCT